MDLENIAGFTLRNLGTVNVVLGKNGCGKSYMLKQVEQNFRQKNDVGRVRYISPERGGLLKYEAGVDQAILQNVNWMDDQRRKNQSGNFRNQSITLFRRLELLVLREIERDQYNAGYLPRNFNDTMQKINSLLDRVRLERDDGTVFKIIDRETGSETTPEAISSGEAELVSLGVEFLAFIKEVENGKENLLFVDEPDVHLHPDLQDRLAQFVVTTFEGGSAKIIIATHSTALLAGLARKGETRVSFMRRKDRTLAFKAVSDVDKAIMPIFGAHPLSNVFNEAPVLLVEGEDDERVWQQAIRSAGGKFRVYPCAVDGVDRISEFETEVNNIIQSVYDNAIGYSLRDRDANPELIDDVGSVQRMRLQCRAAENLMLSDESLEIADTDWPSLQRKLTEWVDANPNHKYFADVQAFVRGGLDRMSADLKAIRNIIVGLVSNKPWEVLGAMRGSW